jgi:hypothetical protein
VDSVEYVDLDLVVYHLRSYELYTAILEIQMILLELDMMRNRLLNLIYKIYREVHKEAFPRIVYLNLHMGRLLLNVAISSLMGPNNGYPYSLLLEGGLSLAKSKSSDGQGG